MNNNKIHFLFRTFRRHYHKVRDVYEELSKHERFSLEVRAKNGEMTVQNTVPDEGLTVRFVVLMRRFLSPSDQLYYGSVWKLIREEFHDEISDIHIEKINNIIELLKNGEIGININGEKLTAEQIYEIISRADYFQQEAEAKKRLQNLTRMPIVGPILVDQFYGYSLNAFRLASQFFEIIRAIQESNTYKRNYLPSNEDQALCIYCLSETGEFTSEEHAFPESLGNDEVVLPIGYVCDKCNNTTLSELDNFLVNFDPIAFLRVQYIPFTKGGKLPKANFQNAALEKIRPTRIHYTAKDKSANIKNVRKLENGQISFSIPIRGKQKYDPVKLARSLYKVALGTAAFDLGKKGACEKRYNAARSFVLGKSSFKNNFIMCFKGTPHPLVHVTHKPLKTGTPFLIDIFGIIFMLNLEELPVLELNKEMEKADFKSFALD